LLIIKSILGVIFQLLFYSLLLFIPVGTIYWNGIIWLIIYSVIIGIGAVYLINNNPDSIDARSRIGFEKQPIFDKFASFFLFISIIIGFITCPLDVFHWQLSERPNELLRYIGLIVYSLGLIIILSSMASNSFIAPTVYIQDEEGQKVINTGLYAFVRLTMHTGFLLMMIGTFLWLGTLFSFLVGIILLFLSILFIISIEEKTLINDLNGYRNYTEKVKARLIPFIF